MPTTVTMMVASALMSGVTPSLTLDHTRISSVVAPGPEVKDVMTTDQPAMPAGSRGRVGRPKGQWA